MQGWKNLCSLLILILTWFNRKPCFFKIFYVQTPAFVGVFCFNWNTMKTSFQNVVWKEGVQFVAQCLNVEVSSFVDTREKALKNLEEALELNF